MPCQQSIAGTTANTLTGAHSNPWSQLTYNVQLLPDGAKMPLASSTVQVGF